MALLPTFVALALVFAASRVINYFQCLKASFRVALCAVGVLTPLKKLGYLPGLRSLATPVSIPGLIFPTSRFNPGANWMWEWRARGACRHFLCCVKFPTTLSVYAEAGTETISALPYIFGPPAIFTSSLEVARQILSGKGPFVKPIESTRITLCV